MIIDPQFFIGTVIKLGDASRVRVVIYGEHDELIEEDQAQLPWSTVMLPTTNAGLPGIAESIGLKKGSIVFGLYVNESDTIILGCIQTTSVATSDSNVILPKKVPTRTELDEIAAKREERMIIKHGEGLGEIKNRERQDKRKWTPEKQAHWDNEYNEYYKNHPEDPNWDKWNRLKNPDNQ